MDNKIVATVNGEPVLQQAVDFELQRLIHLYQQQGMPEQQLRLQLDALKEKALEQAIGTKLLINEAKRLNIPVSNEELNAQFERYVTQFGGNRERLEKAIEAQGMTVEAFKQELRQGVILSYADFYALMPPDNSATVAPGTDVSFPQNGPIANTNIGRLSPSSFNLGPVGTYQILFQVSVTEAGQLILTLNGQDLSYTVAGRATGTSQIVGMAVVTTTATNSILTVRNPSGNAAALTVTPLAGGTRSVSAHLVITQIS